MGPAYRTPVVRAIMLARLNGMARGGAGVSPQVFATLMKMLNRSIHPVVPSRGSVGMSDLAQLAHLSLPLIGLGEVEFEGEVMPSPAAFKRAGLEPCTLGAKDGLALCSANSASTGHGALVLANVIRILAYADIAAALSFEAFRANPSPLDERLQSVRPHPGQVIVMERFRALLNGSALCEPGAEVALQDPLSYRCISQVHGACNDSLTFARSVVEVELNSTGDNPIVLPDEGSIISNGNFHPAGLSMAFDMLAMAVGQLVGVATARVLRLNEPRLSRLPDQLTGQPGLNSGMGVLQKTITALNSEARFLASPGSLDYMPIANSIEDHSTMATFVVSKADKMAEIAQYVLAIEMLCSTQGIDLRDKELRLGQGTQAAYDVIRGTVSVMEEDRVVADDVAAVYGLLSQGKVLDAVNANSDYHFGLLSR